MKHGGNSPEELGKLLAFETLDTVLGKTFVSMAYIPVLTLLFVLIANSKPKPSWYQSKVAPRDSLIFIVKVLGKDIQQVPNIMSGLSYPKTDTTGASAD